MEADTKLEARIRKYSDEELLTVLKAPTDYEPQAVQYAREELDRRGGIDAAEMRVSAAPEPGDEEVNVVGFTWWKIWAWLGLTLGSLMILVQLSTRFGPAIAVAVAIAHAALMVMVLRYSRYAFLVATIVELNPLLWLINGVYLKKRWHHPLLTGKPCTSAVSTGPGPTAS